MTVDARPAGSCRSCCGGSSVGTPGRRRGRRAARVRLRAPGRDGSICTPRESGRCCCAAAADWRRRTLEGLWDSPDLVAVIRLAARNAGGLDRLRARLAPVRLAAAARRALAASAPRGGARRRDIAAHYDLGNELFARMLDPTMSYSCAVFEHHGMTLEQAQVAKLERICETLELGPRDRVLEIGTGWGAFALYAASDPRLPRHHDDDLARAARLRARAGAAGRTGGPGHRADGGLPRPARPLRQARLDRDDRGGRLARSSARSSPSARSCSRPTGRCCCRRSRSMTAPTRSRRQRSRSSTPTSSRAGACPRSRCITRDVARRTDMQVAGLEDITAHYVETLRRWRDELQRPRRRLAELGLRRALPPALDALPRLLRGRIRRAADLRRPAAADQAPLSTPLRPARGRPGRSGPHDLAASA